MNALDIRLAFCSDWFFRTAKRLSAEYCLFDSFHTIGLSYILTNESKSL